MKWHDTPPREKVIQQPEDASFEDLIAVLLARGIPGCDVLELSRRVARLAGSESGLQRMGPGALMAIKGIGMARAATVLACVELARRQSAGLLEDGVSVSSREIAYWLQHRLRGCEHEYFYLFSFDRHQKLVGHHQIARGGSDRVQVYLRDIVRMLLNDRASYTIIAHNHPEASALPSPVDLKQMERLGKLLDDMGIRLLDQLVAGEDGVYSCRFRRFVYSPPRANSRREGPRLKELDRKIQYANPAASPELESIA